jgi:glycosyltransferase involved in cell wall biosynthesis
MALGKAVIANDHPEQNLVIRESGCGVVCPWQPRPFAGAIIRLLEQPAVCEQMGRAGRRYVERHRTHLAMSDLVLDTYRQVLRQRITPVGTPAVGISGSGDLRE